MTDVYCVKCKKKTEQKDPQRVTMKNGKPAQQGSCAICGTKTTLILPAATAPQA
jgi:NAD-dependent SIR2 family protein deacetylase